jgi:isopenicillin-N N-acyltransferase-like protein
MTTPMPVPLVRVFGSHREAGRQIGEACADEVGRACVLETALPPGRTLDQQLALAAEYRAVTERALPRVVEELDGVAEGAAVDPLALFAASIEEIWTVRPSQPVHPGPPGRCSDLVAAPPLAADGRLLVAHNNDLSPDTERELIAIERRVDGEPPVFTIGIGPWISVGWNAAGLSLTGNELTPNDERVGVPRLLLVRDVLRHQTMDSAVAACLRPDRASSYNNLLAHSDGSVACVEGSATDAELLRPAEDGTLAHTNHYVSSRMLPYEGDPEYAGHSDVRYRRARALLAGMAERPGSADASMLRAALADHENAPDSLCRHPAAGDSEASKTVFWCIADVTERRVTYGRGNACDSEEQVFAFA